MAPPTLDWEGLHNVRDLGGHTTTAGGTTRFGAYVRADNLDRLSEAGWRSLVDYGVHTVVDLRLAEERQIDPPAGLPLVSRHQPLLPDFGHHDWDEINGLALGAGVPEATELVYIEFLERYRERFGLAVTTIASADDAGAVVFHCMGGKDRTGLIAALLLSIADVEPHAIAADYALSGENLRGLLDAWIAAAEDDDDRALRTRIGATPAEAMLGVLAMLDERYGGCGGIPAGCRRRRRAARPRSPAAARMSGVLAIFGPTASGKSSVAESIARRIPAELVAADSAQLYRGLPILTNQSPAVLVGVWPLDHEASVAEFQVLAHQAIDAALAAGRTPVVVGGTGLYLRSALAELDLPPAPSPGARDRWGAVYDEQGAEQAHALLAERDPEAAVAVHPNDRRRVIRALELAEAGHSLRGDRLWAAETRRPTFIAGLDVQPEELNRRIVDRTRGMFDAGVEDEVRHALEAPLSSTARKIMGLREIAELPRQEAEAELVARTRRLAAYQRKWMRRIPGLVSVQADRSPDEVADEILALASGGQRIPAGRTS